MAERVILHVDMDAFFASVEQRDHPEWRGKPVIVGAGPHERGVVSTCSYEARAFGVHSAMPSRMAYALCPNGIFVPPRMAAYEEASARAFEVFGHYTPYVEGVSVDEAFLDVTGSIRLFGSPGEIGRRLRAEVRAACGLSCSVGIAANRLMAKIASEEAKPDGLFEMPQGAGAVRAWLAPKPLKILWGVGKRTDDMLREWGFRTCGDLQRADPALLRRTFGESVAASLAAHARGEDDSPVAWESGEAKSVSREHTFAVDESDRSAVRAKLLELVADVGVQFRADARRARTGRLKLRDAAFATSTRQARFERPARDDISFRRLALELFDRTWPEGASRSIRLIGFGVADFVGADEDDGEPSLFPSARDAERDRRERLSAALDAIRARFGRH